MQITIVPTTDFVHGRRSFHEGEDAEVDLDTAQDLEKSNLVRIKQAPPHRNKMREDPSGKAPAAGRDAPSPSSPAARVPGTSTPPLPNAGETRIRKRGS